MKTIYLFTLFLFLGLTSFSQRGKLQKKSTATKKVSAIDAFNGTAKRDSVKPKEKKDTTDKIIPCNCNKDIEFDQERNMVYSKLTPDRPPFTGTCVAFYPNDKLQIKASFVEGKEDGTTVKFYESGVKNVELNHSLGVPHGPWKFGRKDSTLRWTENYVMGNLDGKKEWFYPDGSIKKVHEYVGGAKTGRAIEYYTDGTLKKEIFFKDNEFHGSYKKYTKDSILKIEKHYDKGILDGESNFYYDDGEVANKTLYKKGNKHGTWNYYFENGNEKAIEMYNKGKKEGVWKVFHDNLKLKSEITYRKDKMVNKKEFDRYGREK